MEITAEIKALILTIIIIAMTLSTLYYGSAMYVLYSFLGIVFSGFLYLIVLAIIKNK